MAGGVPEFAVETLEPVSVDLKTTIPATIRGLQDVEIRPRVSGFITKLCVDEGAVVKKGQPLFLIDKVQYEAARNAAEAAVKVAEANVATNRLTVKNKTDLQAQNIISEYDLEDGSEHAEDCRGPARAGESPAGVGRSRIWPIRL